MEKGLPGGRYEPLTGEDMGRIHGCALRVLEEVGVKVELPEARDIFRAGGAKIEPDSDLVKLPPAMVEKHLAQAPSQVILYGRDTHNDLYLEGKTVYMGTGGAAIHVIDLDSGLSRSSSLRDVAHMAKVVERMENIHFYVIPCTAQDVPPEKQSINEFYAALSNTGKNVMGAARTVQDVRDVIDMASMICGGREQLAARPFISFVTSWMVSPLTFEPDVTAILMEVVGQGIPVALSAAPIAGATAPVTMAGVLTQLHAEEMAGVVFTQILNPGAPVLYGGIPGMADMTDLSYRAGGVEFGLMNAAISQLATYIDVPNYCSAGITEARIPGLQAIYEKTFSICQCALAGSNYVHHAAGVLESMLTLGYGQLVIDNEIIGMAMKMVRGMEVDADTLAFDIIKQVGPGGNYLSARHTLKHFRDEYLEPMLLPRSLRTETETLQDNQPMQILNFARQTAREIIEGPASDLIAPEIEKRIREKYLIELDDGLLTH